MDERGDCTETSESLSVHSRLLGFSHSEKNCSLCAAICSTILHASIPRHKAVKQTYCQSVFLSEICPFLIHSFHQVLMDCIFQVTTASNVPSKKRIISSIGYNRDQALSNIKIVQRVVWRRRRTQVAPTPLLMTLLTVCLKRLGRNLIFSSELLSLNYGLKVFLSQV